MRNEPATQRAAIMQYLKTNGSIDPITALDELGIYRLAARIFELRLAGHTIETRTSNGPPRRTAYIYRAPGGLATLAAAIASPTLKNKPLYRRVYGQIALPLD